MGEFNFFLTKNNHEIKKNKFFKKNTGLCLDNLIFNNNRKKCYKLALFYVIL